MILKMLIFEYSAFIYYNEKIINYYRKREMELFEDLTVDVQQNDMCVL